MLKTKAALALKDVLSGAFALETALSPLKDGFQGADILTIATILTEGDTLERITRGAKALREVGSLGEITLAELAEVAGPYLAEFGGKD